MLVLKYKTDYVTADTRQALFRMTLPLLVALILNMMYSLIDSLWIGNLLGKKAMAALTSSTAVILLITCVMVGLTNGIAILLAQAIGLKDAMRVRQMKATSFVVSLSVMAVIIGLCEMGVTPILKALRAPEETFSMSSWYLRIYLIGVLPSYFYMYFTTILRCYGNTMFQMIAILISTLLNAVLDPLFMRLFGFNGVAAATVVTQTLSLVAAIIYVSRKQYFQMKWKDFRVSVAGEIFGKGVPAIVQQSIPALSTMALTTLVSGFDLDAMAAFGIIGKMENMLIYPVMALNMGLTTIVSQCLGSSRPDRMSDYVKCGMKYGGLALFGLSAIIVLLSKNVAWLFVQNETVDNIVCNYFYIAGLGYVIHAITTCFLAGINGMGKTLHSMMLYIFYFLCVRVPLAYILADRFGLDGIWSAFIVSHVVAVCSAFILYQHVKQKKYGAAL